MSMECITTDAAKQLESLAMSGTEIEKTVREITRAVLKEARNSLSKSIHVQLPDDPRQSYRAVRHMVYKSVLGGNISILNKRRGSVSIRAVPDAPQRTGRGGNRIPRSQRTKNLMGYYGTDRGFVLRFLNSGTPARSTNGTRYVGQISPLNIFTNEAETIMRQAAEHLAQLIEKEIQKHQ